MNYQSSSRSQKERSRTSSDTASSSRPRAPTTSVPPSLKYFTAAASSSVPYESPYAQNQDRRPQRPSDSSVYSASRSTSGLSATRAPHSTQSSSSSSNDSFYGSPGSCGSRYSTSAGTMSSSRTMSSVSPVLPRSFLCFSVVFLHSAMCRDVSRRHGLCFEIQRCDMFLSFALVHIWSGSSFGYPCLVSSARC